ncbi:MAG TPA: FKBP-type peptidyl-prolyl cis-trans isomerase [Candidatus Blautia avicola]|uniref:Peptidyl-prolyl cis-trans isomerase n=1 Tax=Candidatus Blautia avicola TaxID=2838483 RepID=A0A9D2TX05_9FIRM|nr:FKBP-type peptidyl-prolyl cis-trans isomerase [Candidatus Blautia avicola]
MKKENRKLAQQRRAQERQKQKKIRKLKKFLAWFIPGIIILLLVIVLVADAVRNAGSEDSQEAETTESTSDTGSEDTSSEDGSAEEDSQESGSSTLSADTSLTVKDGDTVNIDYVGSIDGVEFDGGSTNGQGTDLTIGSGLYIDDFEEQLIGSHPGDTVDVNVTFPEDYNAEDLRGKDALFVVTINGIYQND